MWFEPWEHAKYVLVLVLVMCWCSIGIGVGMVVGVGMCIGICVGVGVGIGVRIGIVSQHLAIYGIIWWHSGHIRQDIAAPGSMWQHLRWQHLVVFGMI